MFTEAQQKAIEEKFGQLKRVKEGTCSSEELADIITRRRVGWMQEHRDEMLAKYSHLPPEEQAYRIIFFEHMGIDRAQSSMERLSPKKIMIYSYNFCPYLEACGRLGLDTTRICKAIGEPSMREMARMIDPSLRFSRDYLILRPFGRFCAEFIERT